MTESLRLLPGNVGKELLYPGKSEKPGHVSSVGVDMTLNILISWWISESQGTLNSGRLVAISAKMHPIDQISMANESEVDPRSISGARYH